MLQRCRKVCFDILKAQTTNLQFRCNSVMSKAEAKERRILLFEEEKKKQRDAIGRIEKIDVKYTSAVEEITIVMNKHISTPHDCTKHISEGVTKVSALALVDDLPWDMHKPFVSDCELKLLNLQSPQNSGVNNAFWRTCSFMLGAVIDSAFKPDINVHLHSFPVPIIKTGSFVHDVYIELEDWKPTDIELRAMSAQFIKLANDELPIERLEVTEDFALDMFQDNPFKLQQIPDIARNNEDKIILYRVGNYVDISKGPMIGNTYLIGRCTIAAVHRIGTADSENIYRFQGIALPKGVLLNHFAYSILEKRARNRNDSAWIPQSMIDTVDRPMKMSAQN